MATAAAQSWVGTPSVYRAPCYALHAPALPWDFHSDKNHPALDSFLVDQMLFSVSYQLITCNAWQSMKSIDGGL